MFFLVQLLPFLASCQAYFVLSQPILEVTRLDPIVSPGGVSSHVHTIAGGSNFDKSMTYSSMRAGGCTTAAVTVDMSNYWIPQLYYYNPADGSYQAIPAQNMNAYYLPRAGSSGIVKAFPDGLRMTSGSPDRRSFVTGDPSSAAISYVCLDYSGSHSGDPAWAQRNNFFSHNCPQGMRAQVNFPPCWDGVNLDSTSHQSHMAWPSGGVDGGECPSTHPVHLVSLFYEFIFEVQNFPFNDPSVPTWVWANGDTTGYGLHADFVNGWPSLINGSNVLQDAINQCNANNGVGGELQNCPPFVPYLNNAAANACRPQNNLVNEDVGMGHSIPQLPGNNPLWIGNGSKPTNANYTEPTTTYTNFSSVIPAGYVDVGCIAEGTSGRALTGASLTNANMTRGACVSWCQSQGFPLAGVEYGSQCYCDVAMRNGASNTTLLPATQCGMQCANNTYENCGGSSTLELFNSVSMYKTVAASLSVIPSGYTDVGCIAEASSGRALTGASFSNANMTRGACVSFCQSRGFPLAGVEYGQECYCDNVMRNGASNMTLLDASKCGMKCANNTWETCGGSSTLELFNNPSLYVAPVASVALTSVIPAGWTDTGCIAEGPSGRALSAKSFSSSNMTRGACVSWCAAFGYPLAGIEYSSECYCDIAMRNGASNTTFLPASKCSMPCANNTNEFCGGGSTLELFTNPALFPAPAVVAPLPTGWTASGCMTEATSGRALSIYQVYSNSMNTSMCLNACAAKGYKYAGVEYASQCYCGNSFNAGSIAAPSTDCNMACAGDATSLCGGGNRLTTYVSSLVVVTSSSSSASSSSSSSLSSSTGSASTSSGTSVIANAKVAATSSSASSTPASSSTSASSSVSASSSTPASTSSKPATSSSAVASSTPPSSSSSTTPSSTSSSPATSSSSSSTLNYIGCFTDSNTRTLNGTFTYSGTPTNENCMQTCAASGYPYAGTENGDQCFCGKYLNKSLQVSTSSCNTACVGSSTEKCGGAWLVSIYQTSITTGGVITGTTPNGVTRRSRRNVRFARRGKAQK